MIETPPILITGASRSGASMIAGVFNKCGAFGGNMAKQSNDYDESMYSNNRIRETLVKLYLIRLDSDENGQYPLPEKIHIPKGWKEDVEKIMISEGYKQGPWMYKDSRITLMWQVWHDAFPDAKWVIVRRRTGDIIQSCVKTGFMKAFKIKSNREMINMDTEQDAWLWWVHEYEKRFVEMITEGINCRVIWPERMINDDYKQMFELIDWLGLKWNTGAMELIDNLLGKKRREVTYGSKNDNSRG